MKPMYERGPVQLYHGNNLDVLPHLKERGIIISDTPYSKWVHEGDRTVEMPDGAKRISDFGFGHLDPMLRRAIARHAARLTSRWALFFSDNEGVDLWKFSLLAADPNYTDKLHKIEERRLFDIWCEQSAKNLNEESRGYFLHHGVGAWVKIGAKPALRGIGPASGTELIEIAHTKVERSGIQRRWNGGGGHALWQYPIVRDTKDEPRIHTTPKPLGLMVDLVSAFSEPDELVYDVTMGRGSTCIGALRARGGRRRFVGVEVDGSRFEEAVKLIDAELDGSTYVAKSGGQCSLYDGVDK